MELLHSGFYMPVKQGYTLSFLQGMRTGTNYCPALPAYFFLQISFLTISACSISSCSDFSIFEISVIKSSNFTVHWSTDFSFVLINRRTASVIKSISSEYSPTEMKNFILFDNLSGIL